MFIQTTLCARFICFCRPFTRACHIDELWAENHIGRWLRAHVAAFDVAVAAAPDLFFATPISLPDVLAAATARGLGFWFGP